MDELAKLVTKEEMTLEKYDNETGKLVERVTVVNGEIISKEEF